MTEVATRLTRAPAATTSPAEDLGRARTFYEERLGLEVETRDEMPEGLFVRAAKDGPILIDGRGRGGDGDATSLTFAVDDLEATVAESRSSGVVFEEYDFPGLKTVNGIAARDADKATWFKDSENNILCVHRTLS